MTSASRKLGGRHHLSCLFHPRNLHPPPRLAISKESLMQCSLSLMKWWCRQSMEDHPRKWTNPKKVRLFMKQNKFLLQNISFKVASFLFYILMKATGHTKNYIGSLLVFILDMPCWIRVVASSLLHNVTCGTIRCMLLGLSCRQSWPRCHKKSQRLKVVFSHGAPCF